MFGHSEPEKIHPLAAVWNIRQLTQVRSSDLSEEEEDYGSCKLVPQNIIMILFF